MLVQCLSALFVFAIIVLAIALQVHKNRGY
jgi:hypothetical protein